MLCKYTQQVSKGEINDIHFENIQVLNGDIPVSLIRGYQSPTEEVRVHDIFFDDISFMGQKCETWQDLRLVTELANDIYVNEINTIPGSLSFYLWEATNISFDKLVDKLIDLAFKRNQECCGKTISYDQNIFNISKGAKTGGKMGGKM